MTERSAGPSFVYTASRFVEISGLDEEPALSNFTGKVVYDRMETTGWFETSNQVINQTFKNAYWGIRGNYRGMPTDCPQRDERQGWLGDRATGCFGKHSFSTMLTSTANGHRILRILKAQRKHLGGFTPLLDHLS